MNRVKCDRTIFDLDKPYRDGALANRAAVPITGNPYRLDSVAYYQWDYGFINEAAGEHIRFGTDVITSPNMDLTYLDDPEVVRIKGGDIDLSWYRATLVGLEPKQPLEDFLRQHGLVFFTTMDENRKPAVGVSSLGGDTIPKLFKSKEKARLFVDQHRSLVLSAAKNIRAAA